MRIMQKTKDGGKESTVDAYFLIELKGWFSVALLKFNKGSRVNYHSHAFDALTWFIKGDMVEFFLTKPHRKYRKSLFPKLTRRTDFHKVVANKPSWCFTVRGPWQNRWEEYNPKTGEFTTLTHGRKVVQ